MVGEKHIVSSAFLASPYVDGDGSIYDHIWPRQLCRLAGSYFPLRTMYDDQGGNPDHGRCFGSWHNGMCPFAFADGHVTDLNVAIDLPVLNLLAQYNNSQAIPNY